MMAVPGASLRANMDMEGVGTVCQRRLWRVSRHFLPPAPRACAADPEPPEPPAEMSDMEKFMFDLQGYLVVPDFLSPAEVEALNSAFDANWHLRRLGSDASKRVGYDQFYGFLEWEEPHCTPFRELLANQKVIPYLNTIFGRCVPSPC